MRKQLTERQREAPVADPDDEAGLYLQAFAEGLVFDPDSAPEDLLGPSPSPGEILHAAIGLEKDSIVFYVGIKNMVPRRRGQRRIEEILQEEMRHVTQLSDWLRSA